MTALAFKRPDDAATAVLRIKKHHARIPADVCCAKTATQYDALKLEHVSARRIDMHALRRELAGRWGEFCRRHWRNSTDVAAFFDTDERTARFWLEGRHAPSSAFVLRAVTVYPEAVQYLIGEAA